MARNRTGRFIPHGILIMAIMVVAFGAGYLLRGSGGDSDPGPPRAESGTGTDSSGHEQDHADSQVWTCSMHPQFQLPAFGKCPICFMDLIPVTEDAQETTAGPTLELSPAAVAMAEIQTVRVERRHLSIEVRMVGKVDYDETRFRSITARVAGRLDTLRVDFTGTEVKRGQSLAAVYSPELYAAQIELLSAIAAAREVKEAGGAALAQTTRATVEAVRNRLRLWGLTSRQISTIEENGVASEHLDITSPLSGTVVQKHAVEGTYVTAGAEIYAVADLSQVWVSLQAYEKDLAWIAVDQQVTFTVTALPGEDFQGRIAFIDPMLDARSRTVRVRLDVDNQHRLLKPGMYVSAVVSSPADETQPPLVIPITAPLLTGKRAVVYVRLPDTDQPTFSGRQVQLGPRTGDHYVVTGGLNEGEEVVVNGNFKIDSELQIRARPSMMSPVAIDEPISGSAAPPMFLNRLGELLDTYLDIQSALAADDDARATTAANEAVKNLAGVVGSCLDAESQTSWAGDRKQLAAALTSVDKAPDIAGRRKAFLTLSTELWRILQDYGYREAGTVRWIHCPMAFDNVGADWIQREASIANPYYGASMLRCGSQVDSLPPQATDPGGR